MSEEENKDSKKAQNKAEEPEATFKTVRFFDSFEEQEKAEIQWLASQTPRQHLQHTVSFIERIFADDLDKNPEIGHNLKFK